MSAQPPIGPAPQAPNATAALVLGILGVVLCPLCGPVAWALGRRAEQAVDASGGVLGGRGLATAGKILGIVGSVFILLLIALFAVGLGGGTEGGSGYV